VRPAPASPSPGPDQDPESLPLGPSGDLADWEAWLALDLDDGEPPPEGSEGYLDPEGSELPWGEDLAAIVAETDQIAAERAADAEYLARAGTAELAGAVLADEARWRGPRGPGLPGSAERLPGVSSGSAGGFGTGECLDVAPDDTPRNANTSHPAGPTRPGSPSPRPGPGRPADTGPGG
jgi:hypothetical protein